MDTHNISFYDDESTARTCIDCAVQRAENLAVLDVKSVLELCVGPSLRQLEQAYKTHSVEVAGNDIDPRWKQYYPKGKWLIGDATKLSETSTYDAVVVAPPLSKGCSGKRNESLSLEQVTPNFYDFTSIRPKIVTVYVLPGRTLSVKDDRKQLHKFLKHLEQQKNIKEVSVVPLKFKNKVTKYVDVYTVFDNKG